MPDNPFRRNFLGRMAGLSIAGTALSADAAPQSAPISANQLRLPEYACAQDYRSLKQSSYDRTGGNGDAWPIAAGGTKEVFSSDGPGVITHIWFTTSRDTHFHSKE